MSSTTTWIILTLCSAYASPIPTTELPTTRRYNLLKGHNKTHSISKFDTPTQNIPSVLNYQIKLVRPSLSTTERNKHSNNLKITPNKNKPIKKNHTTQLINNFVNSNLEDLRYPNKTIQIKKINQNKTSVIRKNQVEWINISNKPKNDTLGNNFYQIKLENKNPKNKNSTSVKTGNKNHLKENWYDNNIPIPSPNPEIVIYSPQHSISDASESYEDDSIEIVPLNPDNVISQFELDLNKNSSSFEKIDSACPNVHLTNSVLGPSSKQGCSDLNIAINTYLNHNQNRLPERLPIVTNDLEAASSGGSGTQILPPPGLAASAPAAGLDTLSNPVGAVASDSGGGGPLGGLPSLPQFPKLPKLPNLNDIMSLLRLLGKSLGLLNGALSKLSPLLYIIPVISFLFGFITFLPFYPWWLPLFFLAGKSKEPPKTQFIVHKHVHKPVHHNDGWFWNHNTKTWTNVHDRVRYKRSSDELHSILKGNWDLHHVEQPKKLPSWKRRKK